MIPKKIHYCWFGKNQKSELIERCIASWRKYCPDYEIIEWNETNYDISKSEFMKEAYENRKWGFVPDYARFDIIAQNGGIYLDTDVELHESFDDLLDCGAFFAFESGRNICCGLCFGAEKGHLAVDACLKPYLNKHFIVDGKLDLTPSPRINTKSLVEVYPGLVRNGQEQFVSDVHFLGCVAYQKRMQHYGAATWVSGYRKKHVYKSGILKGFLRNPQIFNWVEKHLGERAVTVYTILVYDLIEMGIMYFIIRKLFRK